jgi:hypothetical protein
VHLIGVVEPVDREGFKVVIPAEAGGLSTYDDGEVWVSHKVASTD